MQNVIGECECCGAKNVEYRHGLTASLVKALEIFIEKNEYGLSLEESGLSHTQICNFQKLRYWGLIDRIPYSSEWYVTDSGVDFINGVSYCRRHVWTYRGEFVRFEGEFGKITDVYGGWKTRVEYAQEAVPHFSDER